MTAEQLGAPKGLIQCLDRGDHRRHRRADAPPPHLRGHGDRRAWPWCDAAYSSGKPTLAVGAGNVPCYVHASMAGKLDEVAEQIITSTSFDYGTACVSEQSVIADRDDRERPSP